MVVILKVIDPPPYCVPNWAILEMTGKTLNAIFCLAARSDHSKSTAKTLVLVSRDVNRWIKPLLYESLVVSRSERSVSQCDTVLSLPPAFVAKAVRNIYFISYRANTRPLLKLCTGIQTFVIFGSISYNIVAHLRPKHVVVDCILLRLPKEMQSSVLLQPFFSCVTHLELVGSRWVYGDSLRMLPCLTHLSLSPFFDEGTAEVMRNVVNLAKDNRCKAIVVHYSDRRPLERQTLEMLESVHIQTVCKQQRVSSWTELLAGITIWDKLPGKTVAEKLEEKLSF